LGGRRGPLSYALAGSTSENFWSRSANGGPGTLRAGDRVRTCPMQALPPDLFVPACRRGGLGKFAFGRLATPAAQLDAGSSRSEDRPRAWRKAGSRSTCPKAGRHQASRARGLVSTPLRTTRAGSSHITHHTSHILLELGPANGSLDRFRRRSILRWRRCSWGPCGACAPSSRLAPSGRGGPTPIIDRVIHSRALAVLARHRGRSPPLHRAASEPATSLVGSGRCQICA
jgi:hypothetical protein